MQRVIPFLLLSGLLACLPLPIATPPPIATPTPIGEIPPSGDLAEEYHVVGTTADGSTYEGTLYVEQHGPVYWLTWEIGTQTYTGVGILQDDVLSVGWDAGGMCAAVSYQVMADGRLKGLWSICGTTEIGTEEATPRRDAAHQGR